MAFTKSQRTAINFLSKYLHHTTYNGWQLQVYGQSAKVREAFVRQRVELYLQGMWLQGADTLTYQAYIYWQSDKKNSDQEERCLSRVMSWTQLA